VKNFLSLSILSVTLIISACGEVSAPEENDPATEQNNANSAPSSESQSTPNAGAATDTPTTQNSANETQNTANANVPSETNQNVPQPTAPAADVPVIDITGTSFYPEQTAGDLIVLDGSNSTVESSQLVAFQWEQVDSGAPTVELINANTASAYFAATTELSRVRLKFKLTVTAANGKTASTFFEYRWTINAAPEIDVVEPPTTEPEVVPGQVDQGSYSLGTTGNYHAISAENVFVADQDLNQIINFDAISETEIKTYALTAKPNLLIYVEAARSLYVGLEAASKMVKINIDTDEQVSIDIAGPAQWITAHDNRVYYTVDAGFYRSSLHSFGDNNISKTHGIMDGSLFEINPVSKEVVAVAQGVSPATVYRYSLPDTEAMSELQSSRSLGSNANGIAISDDGIQLAIASGSGNGAGYTIHDLVASDLTVSNGAWDTGAYPSSADFNSTGTLFTATNYDSLIVFDAKTHVAVNEHIPNENTCGLNYYNVDKASFSDDDQFVFVKLACGSSKEKTVLFFYRLN